MLNEKVIDESADEINSMGEMTIEEQIAFLSNKIINIVNNMKNLNEDKKEEITNQVEEMITNPKHEDVSRLMKLSTYLEEKTLT